jgi:hypothetical protein
MLEHNTAIAIRGRMPRIYRQGNVNLTNRLRVIAELMTNDTEQMPAFNMIRFSFHYLSVHLLRIGQPTSAVVR